MEYLSDLLSSVKSKKKKKQIQTVAVKIRMDCDGCGRKVKKVLSGVKGTIYDPFPFLEPDLEYACMVVL